MVQLLFALLVLCMMVGCAASVFIGSVIVLALFALLLCFLYFVLGGLVYAGGKWNEGVMGSRLEFVRK